MGYGKNQSWGRSDIVELYPIPSPPDFILSSQNPPYSEEEKRDVVQHHYNQIVSVLNENGTSELITVEKRLDGDISKAEGKVDEYDSRMSYNRLRLIGINRKVTSIAKRRADSKAPKVVEKEKEKVFSEPIGEAWRKPNGTLNFGYRQNGWSVIDAKSPPSYTEGEDQLTNAIVHFAPKSGTGYEFNDDHISGLDRQSFRGSESWDDVFESVRSQFEWTKEMCQKARRTVDLLNFRHSIVQTVFYRFRALGDTNELTDEEARNIVELPNVFEGRPILLKHAEKVVEKYREDPAGLPEKVGAFKAWLGTEGENIVKQLQKAIREANISDRYEDGNPESLCELIEELVERHYEN